MTFVLDASAALSWYFADESTESSARLLALMQNGAVAAVPAHWATEMLSALLQGKRRGRIDDAELLANLHDLASLPIQVDRSVTPSELIELSALSRRLNLNA